MRATSSLMSIVPGSIKFARNTPPPVYNCSAGQRERVSTIAFRSGKQALTAIQHMYPDYPRSLVKELLAPGRATPLNSVGGTIEADTSDFSYRLHFARGPNFYSYTW